VAASDGEGVPRERFRALARDHARLDGLDLYARVTQEAGARIGDEARIDTALSDIRRALLAATSSDSTLHGWRVQVLFEAVVVSLGRVRLIKQEDNGDVYFSGPDLKPPDFRVVTDEPASLLIEVKNAYQKQPQSSFRMRRREMAALLRYIELAGPAELLIAVYWSRWNLWTLVSPDQFGSAGDSHVEISLPDAMKANAMGTLGDRFPGTEWPLALTLYSDESRPRRADDGEAIFTIGRAEYSVAGRVVSAPKEQQIVHMLMLHGGWNEDTPAEIVDGEIVSTSFVFVPEEHATRREQFALHNPLSSIYSSMFNDATLSHEGEFADLRVELDPSSLSSLIPDDYEGDVLRVWRLHLSAS
jgi:hypothetical protein